MTACSNVAPLRHLLDFAPYRRLISFSAGFTSADNDAYAWPSLGRFPDLGGVYADQAVQTFLSGAIEPRR